MRLALVCGALVLAGGIAGSGVAARTSAPKPHTVLSTSTRILKFAADGDWVAWSVKEQRCRLGLRLLSLRTHERIAVRGRGDGISCGTYGGLALAGDRALWTSLAGAGNTELDVAVSTASATSPVARRVQMMAMIRPEFGDEPLAPPVAGRGQTLAYYRHEDGIGGSPVHTLERADGARPERVFRLDNPSAIAIDHGRIGAARRGVLRGSACNCHFDPAWSPDGSTIAFLSGQECCVSGKEHADIYLMRDAGYRTQVTTDGTPKSGLAWSPDGTRLAFGYYDSKFALELAVINADGTGRHNIAGGEYPSWSPDGTKLAFDDLAHVYVVGADGSGLRELAGGTMPAWSPDGTRIAYSASGALFSIRPDGTDNRRLATSGKSPAWSPDGSTIAYSSNKGIVLSRSDGSGAHLLRNTAAGDDDPAWSADGTRIAFDSLRNDLAGDGIPHPELYVTDAAGGKIQPLLFSTYDDWNTAVQVRSHYGRLLLTFYALGAPLGLALDGKYQVLLTQRARATVRELQVFPSKGVALHQLPVPATATSLSASGGYAVYAAGRTIRAVDLHSGSERLLAFTAGPVVGVAVSGRRVTWAENVGARGRIRTLLLPR